MKSLIVSAPFGNYPAIIKKLTGADFTPTMGTFTAEPRGFTTKPYGGRLTRILLTLRYSPTFRSWKNKLGLKNPGIKWLQEQVASKKIDVSDKIVSIYGWSTHEWEVLVRAMSHIKPLAVEVNASCPNVDKLPFDSSLYQMLNAAKIKTIVKLPPVGYRNIAEMAYLNGVQTFHATNTLPTPKGGLSGKALLPIALDVVRDLRLRYSAATIIGGGGITEAEDALKFTDRGANHVAIGSMLFNPFNWKNVSNIQEAVSRGAVLSEVLA